MVKKEEKKKIGCLVTEKSEDTFFRPATAGLPRIRDMTQISSPEKRRRRLPAARSQVLPVVGSQLAERARRRHGGHEVNAAERI